MCLVANLYYICDKYRKEVFNAKKKITRMDKSKELHGLNKIPDSILLKECKIENGKLKSYIQELEAKISNNLDVKKSIKIAKTNRRLVAENKKLRSEISKLKSALANTITNKV